MKRTLSALVLMVLVMVFCFLLPTSVFGSQENPAAGKTESPSGGTIGNDEAPCSLAASPETLELARTAVSDLEHGLLFSTLWGVSLDHMYRTAMWAVPEVNELETKEDASLALIELYEELLGRLREYDLVHCHTFVKGYAEREANEQVDYPDSIASWRQICTDRSTIEALLAVDCYYDKLDADQTERMTRDFQEFFDLDYAAAVKVYGEGESSTLFQVYRSMREQPRSISYFQMGNIIIE